MHAKHTCQSRGFIGAMLDSIDGIGMAHHWAVMCATCTCCYANMLSLHSMLC
jgi:hypothetical protein